jgi:hypothetical protein
VSVTVDGERAARNQSIFRDVNEQIAMLRDAVSPTIEFVCECLDLDCRDRISVTRKEYLRVRATSTRFLIAPGHTGPRRVERLVRGCERFEVVQKIGEAGSAAAALR